MTITKARIQPIRLILCRDPLVWRLYVQLSDSDLFQVLKEYDHPRSNDAILGISRETLSRRFLTEEQIVDVKSVIDSNTTKGVCEEFHVIICTVSPLHIPSKHLFPVPLQEVS